MAAAEDSAAALPSPAAQPLLRKNGKQQSCEPCRKSKLACDHAIPCGRCSRLRRVSQCIYDPCPAATERTLKKRRLSPPDGTAEDGKSTSSTSLVTFVNTLADNNQGDALAVAKIPVVYPENNRALDAESRALQRPAWSSGLQRRQSVKFRPGFMGKTAYSAILNEYERSLGHDLMKEDATSPIELNQEVDPQCIQLGAEILSCLPSFEVSRRALSIYFKRTVAVSLHLPTVEIFHEDFWTAYGDYLAKPRTTRRLLDCSRLITQRALERPFVALSETNAAYFEALTSRWEMLGVLFCTYAALSELLGPFHEVIQQMLPNAIKSPNFARSMIDCAEACLRMVDGLDTGLNGWVAYLSYRCSSLRSLLTHSGETNYKYWRRNVQLCGDMTALGYHRLSGPFPKQAASLLHLEQQKRTFVVSFAHDKHMAVFLGRPPSLSKRYVTTLPILDVSDESLLTDDITTIRAGLNEHGYNKAGRIYRASIIMVFYSSSLFYEDILELSMGASIVDYDRVRAVKAELDEHIRRQPAAFHRPINRELFQSVPILESFGAVEVQLVNLHQRFLLDRIERGTEDLDFGRAEEMLRIVLTFWTERESFPGHEDDNRWVICCYGIPAASAIAVGLWKAPKDCSWRHGRSETIQNLSLFIACLDWVKPVDGNYELCQRTINMLREILDRVLAPPPQEPLAEISSTAANDFGNWDLTNFSIAGMPNFGIEMDDLFSSEWMNAPRANFN